ncbi:MAG: glycoside hydrolase family 2 protein, partial [Clostridia bacterium]|nr:glycoside hydrolase family 2 protein [Clostridia bacterium]
ADMAIIREIGANTLRLAHYQHAQEFYDLCDENGIVVWAEIPYITMHMKNGRENTLSQMRELITQCYNHPSIAVWGLSNEITAASAVNDDLLENHRLLNDLCHRMDGTRLTTMANVFMLETDSPILEIPDINSYNLYFGWYLGELSQNDEFFDEYHARYPDRVIGFSEYGADANPAYHAEHPEKGDYTEDYQALYHEHMLRMIEERPYLWATHVWNLFDFAADGRDEGGKHGENQKGQVTFDRSLRKDAFYLYKAAWNRQEPFVHLCGKRYQNRAVTETEIKVYSNQPAVTLYVDGTRMETQEGRTVFRFRVPLLGEHMIRAEAGDATDTMCVRRVSEPDASYVYNKAAAAVTNWFDAGELDPSCFSINDTLGEIRAHPQAGPIVEQMMARFTAARGDVAESVKDNPALQRMMSRITMVSLLKQAGADEESIRGLNRVLQGIKK